MKDLKDCLIILCDTMMKLLDVMHGQNLSQPFLQELTEDTGLPILCIKEIIWICVNMDDILLKVISANININLKLVSICQHMFEKYDMIKSIEETHRKVSSINPDLVMHNLQALRYNPKTGDITGRQHKVKEMQKINKNDKVHSFLLLVTIDTIKDFTDHY